MGRFKIMALLWKMRALLAFPGIEDTVALRNWVLNALGLLDEAADMTETEADDMVVDALEKVVNNDAAWDGLCSILAYLQDKQDDEIELLTSGTLKVGGDLDVPHVAEAIGEKVGIDPVTIISLVMMALKALRWFRENRRR